MRRFTCLIGMLVLLNASFAQLMSPDDFLPHKIGEHFTPHYMLVDYMYHIAENSPNAQIVQYGTSNQDRPLLLLYISTPENLAQLDDIRMNNLRKTGMVEGDSDKSLDKAIVWISHSVHGNEASAAESAILTAYELTNPQNQTTKKWLENTIVIIDPTLNPDGSSRYIHWFRNNANLIPNPHSNTYEHAEPWPGGRVNHYLFDLNRDWCWQTQKESVARIKMYHEWMPHIHADIHEQGYNSPYYFAPAAHPYHEYITDWQSDFQVEIGHNHEKYFDKNNWLYFTREVFDLLYPSYGDTYPIYNGSIGMTFEQAGGSRAGRAVIMENEDTLTLMDRVMHHHTAALSTVEVSSNNAARIVENFETYYNNNQNNPQGEYKTYIIPADQPQGRLEAFLELMDKNHIKYGSLGKSSSLKGFNYSNGQEESISVGASDLVISAYQPKATLVQILMDPNTFVEDSLTYDITAWSLPYAYGLKAYASKTKVDVSDEFSLDAYEDLQMNSDEPYAYLARWNSLKQATFLSAIFNEDIKVRMAQEGFKMNNESYDPGTLIITTADNRKMGTAFHEKVVSIANELEQELTVAQSGRAAQGSDFGSSNVALIQKPNVAVLSGEGTSSLSYGQVWYFFEQNLKYPMNAIAAQRIGSTDLSDYNILIMPEGFYSVNAQVRQKLSSWVASGGKLICLGSSVRKLEGQDGFSLKKYATDASKSEATRESEKERLMNRFGDYGDQDRKSVTQYNPGSIVKLTLDTSHPLAFGLSEEYFSLKTNSLYYELLTDATNVGIVGEDQLYAGYMGYKLKDKLTNTVSFAVERKGRGEIVYLVDNPLFRAFWENGKFLFSNALFMVGN